MEEFNQKQSAGEELEDAPVGGAPESQETQGEPLVMDTPDQEEPPEYAGSEEGQEETGPNLIDMIERQDEPAADVDLTDDSEMEPVMPAEEPPADPPAWKGVTTGQDVVTPPDLVEPPESLENGWTEHNAVRRGLAALAQRMDDLSKEFVGKIKYDAHKDEIIDKLHAELQDYKADLVKKAVQSMVLDIVKVIDDIRKMVNFYDGKERELGDVDKLINVLDGIPMDLEDVLSLQGVSVFQCESSQFDPNRQRVIKKIATSEADQDKTVAGSLAPGYEWDGRLIRRELVATYELKTESGEEE